MIINMNQVGDEEYFGGKINLIAYPNPFSGKTTISFKLIEPSVVDLEVFDLTGRWF